MIRCESSALVARGALQELEAPRILPQQTEADQQLSELNDNLEVPPCS